MHQVHPADCISHSPHLITKMTRHIPAHLLILLLIREQSLQMLRNRLNLSISGITLEVKAALAVLDLQWKAIGATSYDRNALVQNREAFTSKLSLADSCSATWAQERSAVSILTTGPDAYE